MIVENGQERRLSFFGMIGIVMAALRFKDWYDDYRRVPCEEDGLPSTGPIALHSPIGGDAPPLPERLILDTNIPTVVKPRRKRSADCCVCCGLRCGLFWKAFGIVCLLTIAWQGMKFTVWAIKPTPTGLENMPEFSTSLGCEDAPYVFGTGQMTYNVPFDTSNGRHVLELKGGAVGTLLLEEAITDSDEIEVKLTVRTNTRDLLDSTSFTHPTRDEISEGLAESRARLNTPRVRGTSCMRYDVVVRVPPSLKDLDIQAFSIAQIQFASEADINLDRLTIDVFALSNNNMLLPMSNVHAKELNLGVMKGWLVGEVSIVERTAIKTEGGDGTANVRILPVASSQDNQLGKAILETHSGAGRSDFFYISDTSATHRTISSLHASYGTGDVYLRYADADVKGKAHVKAKSYTATGLQHSGMPMLDPNGIMQGWVGDRDGEDEIIARSDRGWVGLYF